MRDEYTTRGERREKKRRRRRKMGVSGASVRTLQDIILKKSQDAKPKSAPDPRNRRSR